MKISGYDPNIRESVEIEYDSIIGAVDPLFTASNDGLYLAPGWIDLQVNGYAGVDYNSPLTSHEEIARSIDVLHSTGTTRFFPTVITGSRENMLESLRNLARAKAALPGGDAMEAFHVEGPHICPDDGPRGAHPQIHVRPPDIEEYRTWQEATDGGVRLVTVSPEWPEAPAYVEALVRDGVVVSIGHTKASAEQIQACVGAGATKSTHIGNGAHGVLQRHPNYIWEQLAEDRLTAGFIVDGFHLGAAFLKSALRAKTTSRALLVTDAVMPAMAPPGLYRIGDIDVEHTPDGRVVLAGGTRLAGSALRMDRAIENVQKMAGISLVEALAMATRNAARVGRIGGRIRGLTPGDRADFVQFRWNAEALNMEVVRTVMSGKDVFVKS